VRAGGESPGDSPLLSLTFRSPDAAARGETPPLQKGAADPPVPSSLPGRGEHLTCASPACHTAEAEKTGGRRRRVRQAGHLQPLEAMRRWRLAVGPKPLKERPLTPSRACPRGERGRRRKQTARWSTVRSSCAIRVTHLGQIARCAGGAAREKGPGGPPPGPARRTALGGAAQELRFPLGRTLPQCATWISSANPAPPLYLTHAPPR
jgi:hypothetical protein